MNEQLLAFFPFFYLASESTFLRVCVESNFSFLLSAQFLVSFFLFALSLYLKNAFLRNALHKRTHTHPDNRTNVFIHKFFLNFVRAFEAGTLRLPNQTRNHRIAPFWGYVCKAFFGMGHHHGTLLAPPIGGKRKVSFPNIQRRVCGGSKGARTDPVNLLDRAAYEPFDLLTY